MESGTGRDAASRRVDRRRGRRTQGSLPSGIYFARFANELPPSPLPNYREIQNNRPNPPQY